MAVTSDDHGPLDVDDCFVTIFRLLEFFVCVGDLDFVGVMSVAVSILVGIRSAVVLRLVMPIASVVLIVTRPVVVRVAILEIARIIHALDRCSEVVGQGFLVFAACLFKLVLDGDHLVLNVSQVGTSRVPVLRLSLEVVDRFEAVVEELHDAVLVLGGVLLQVLLAPRHVFGGAIEHVGERRRTAIVGVLVDITCSVIEEIGRAHV